MHLGLLLAFYQIDMEVLKVQDQATGQFNGGEIMEHKPIGFPQDGGSGRPYSNLFYWAHAWTDIGSTIGEHPHQGFEIMSFVLEGEIEHYDSQQQGWSKLAKGGAQVIRSGSGISHAEKLHKGTHMFQIWLDPDLSKSMYKPASYDDYHSHSFTFIEEKGYKVKTYAGQGGPMKLDTPGVEIVEMRFDSGDHTVKLDIEKVHSIYLLDSMASIGGKQLESGDFVILRHEEEIRITAENEAAIFMVSSPLNLDYRTYIGT